MRPVSTLWLATGLAVGLTIAAPVTAAEAPGTRQSAVDQLDQRLRRLENVFDSRQLVELMQRLDDLTGEIRELRGEIETQGHRLKELRERQRRLYGDLDRRLRQVEVAGRQRQQQEQKQQQGSRGNAGGQQSGPSGGGSAAGSGEQPQGAPGAAAGGDSGDAAADAASIEAQRKAYNDAFDLLKDGRYDAAAKAFGKFLEQHPQGPYSDNAQYWLGEARYVTRDFEGALEAFRKTTERYPESSKVPDARLKIGYTLHELERYDEARAMLKKVMSEHGDNTVSRLAEERLLRLERQQRSN